MLGLLCIDFRVKRQLWKWWNVPIEYSWNVLLKSCTSLSSSSCHPARHILTLGRSVLYTQSLPSPLTLCVWPAVPFTLIKITNAPTLPPHPICSHSIAFSSDNWTLCLIDWCDLILWTILQPPTPPPFLCSHLREVCWRDRGHCLWRADVHRVPQRRYKEVRKRTRGTSSSIQLHPTSPL